MSKTVLLIFGLFIVISGCGKSYQTTTPRYIESNTNPQNQKKNDSSEKKYSDGISLIDDGKFHEALIYFERLRNNNPEEWTNYYFLGLIYSNLEKYPEAERNLFRALNLSGESKIDRSKIYTGLGNNYEARGKFGLARLNYHTALNLDPESIGAQDGLNRLKSFTKSR